ncbi:hypothetical protein, partial [Burkholderia pseudomallei]|uniref:hypothetical protein n=1 Tax=Burkholderia pseudomallei TaxID=28450 RepID=UPI0022DBB9A1
MTRIARAAPVASFIEAIARVWRMASRTSCGAHARTIAVLALLPTSSRFLAPSRAFSLHPAPRRHDASASITASPPHRLTASTPRRRPREQRNHADRSSAPPDSIDACARPSPTA